MIFADLTHDSPPLSYVTFSLLVGGRADVIYKLHGFNLLKCTKLYRLFELDICCIELVFGNLNLGYNSFKEN